MLEVVPRATLASHASGAELSRVPSRTLVMASRVATLKALVSSCASLSLFLALPPTPDLEGSTAARAEHKYVIKTTRKKLRIIADDSGWQLSPLEQLILKHF